MRIPHLFSVVRFARDRPPAWLVDNDYLRILFMMGVYYLCAAGMNVLVGYAGEVPWTGRAFRGRRLCGGAPDDELRSRSLDGACRGRGRGGTLRRPDRLAVSAGPWALSRHGHAGLRHRRRARQRVDGGLRGCGGDLRHQALAIAGTPFSNLHWVWFAIALGATTHLLLRNLLCGRFGRAFLSLQADEIAAESVGSVSIATRSWPS